MSVQRWGVYGSDSPTEDYPEEDGDWVLAVDALELVAKIRKLEAQLKHNTDRDYRLGFEDGMRAGLNGGR